MKLRSALMGFAILATVMATSGCAGCGSGYSEGDRVGVVTKFSRRGLIWKSWEGEMTLTGFRPTENGAMVANLWQFSADDQIAAEISKAMQTGGPLKLTYRQWAIAPSFQDTDYNITKVELAGTNQAAQPVEKP